MKTYFNILLVLLFTICIAREIEAGNSIPGNDYFPLKVGNRFIYDRYEFVFGGPPGSHSTYTIAVLKDTIIQNRKYFYINAGIYNNWFRVDSISGSLYMYDPVNSCANYHYEKLRDSLRAELNQIINYCTVGLPTQCTSVTNSTLFGYPVTVKNFYVTNGSQSHNRKYSDKFGPLHTDNSETIGSMGFYNSIDMIGCKIDGVFYGDSDLVGINNQNIPVSFELFQNFPNPFNPKTRINFTLKENQTIKLIVYDLSGKLITTLTDGKRNQGMYHVDFDGSDLPSGIYFYRLESEESLQVKKMILLK